MSNPFEVEVLERTPDVVVLRATGRLDSQSAVTMMEHCERARMAGKHLVLNLAGVSFIASSGIGALLALAEDFSQAERSLRLAEVPTSVDSVLRLLNLEQFLSIDSTEQAALEALEAA